MWFFQRRVREIIFSPGFLMLVVFLLLGAVFQVYLQDHLEGIKVIISSLGVWGSLLFSFLIAAGVIFAPLNGYLIWLAGFYVLGPVKATIFSLIGGWLGGLIAFAIARKFGRPIVIRLVGKKEMNGIDKLTSELGIQALWILRILGGALFDAISYAAGLTNLSVKQFLVTTIVGPIPAAFLVYFLVRNTTNILPILIRVAAVSYIGLIVCFVFLLISRRKKD